MSAANLTAPTEPDLALAANLLNQADCILIGAGAGMSAAAGIDYADPVRFARLCPPMVKRGFRTNYELMGYQGLPPAVEWGYHATHVYHVYHENQEHPVYQELLAMIQDKDYFIMTSNVDGMFYKNHFRPDHIFTPQGSYGRMQCLQPCSQETWDSAPYWARLRENMDPITQEITDLAAIPACPNCGGKMFMNVRGGQWFIDTPYAGQKQLFYQWLQTVQAKTLVMLELGAGFNTPGVIRWPMEQITYQLPNAHLIRINRDYPDVSPEIKTKSVAIQGNIGDIIHQLWLRVYSPEKR